MIDSPNCYEVIVVGAGVAGLSAAYTLRGSRVHVLEREANPGGRVCSVPAWGGVVELGACFAYDPRLLPEGTAPAQPRYQERGPIGIHFNGQLVFGDTACHAVEQLSLSGPVRRALQSLREARTELRDTPAPAARLVRALFQQIHPANMNEYSAARRADAWRDWYPDHWSGGNASLVTAYADPLRDVITLNAHVAKLRETPTEVEVEYECRGKAQRARARAVIVATPAPAARALVQSDDPSCDEFLRCVKYGRYTVVAFALQDARAPAFRCVVTPDAKFALVMQRLDPTCGVRTFLCYYDDAQSHYADTLEDAALVQATARELGAVGVVGAELERASSYVKRWQVSGTILGDEYAARKRAEFSRPTRRIFLAGDYLAMTPDWGYGMDDAVTSGRATGAMVRRLLESEL